VIVAYLLGASVFELVLALQRSISPRDPVWGLAVLAMLMAAVLVFRRTPAAALLAPAAALFVAARFYTGDPYYRPDFRSYSDGGIFPPTWIFVVLGLAILAGVTTHFRRRTAAAGSTAVLLALAFTALFMGVGH